MKRKFNKLQEQYIERKSHEALLDDDEEDGVGGKKNKGFQNLIDNEKIAWSQGEKLEGAKRDMLKMEGVGNDIMRDLHGQTDQLKDITGNVGNMNMELEQSNSIMGRIMKIENRNKIIIAAVAIVILIGLILILYFKLAPSSSDTKSHPEVKPSDNKL